MLFPAVSWTVSSGVDHEICTFTPVPLPSTTVEFVVTCSTITVSGAGTISSAKGKGV